MRRFTIFLMTLLLLVSTAGLNVRLHFCGDALMSWTVNGLRYTTAMKSAMTCCKHGDGCNHCRTVKYHKQVHENYNQGSSFTARLLPQALDWFHGALPFFNSWQLAFFVNLDSSGPEWFVRKAPPCSAAHVLPPHGVRGGTPLLIHRSML